MKFVSSLLLTCLLTLFCFQAAAQIPQFSQGGNFMQQDEPEFLAVEDAFAFSYEQQGDELVIHFEIAPDYYL